MLGEQRRTEGGAQALGRRQVLDGLGHAVHPATGLALVQLAITLRRFGQHVLMGAQRDQRIHRRVEAFDLGQIRLHHFMAGHLPRMDRPRQFDGIQFNNTQGFTSLENGAGRFARGASCMQ